MQIEFMYLIQSDISPNTSIGIHGTYLEEENLGTTIEGRSIARPGEQDSKHKHSLMFFLSRGPQHPIQSQGSLESRQPDEHDCTPCSSS